MKPLTDTTDEFGLGWQKKRGRGMRVKLNSRIERLSECCSEGVDAVPTVGGDSVEDQSPSRPVQIHPQPTGAQGEGRYIHSLVVVQNIKTIFRASQTPRLLVAPQSTIIVTPFPANGFVR